MRTASRGATRPPEKGPGRGRALLTEFFTRGAERVHAAARNPTALPSDPATEHNDGRVASKRDLTRLQTPDWPEDAAR
ncbi:hypothetical protein GCM10010319_71330 [Streptomyces blastmyceticus]|uniref:Uncharacterized protein n=1 Tax=Streptomyces blastmyceticus TaxID=68180 RepID=A0ABN0Y471_9ACTN